MIKSLPYYKKILLILKINDFENKYLVIYAPANIKYKAVVLKNDKTFLCYSLSDLRLKMQNGIRKHNMSIFNMMLNRRNELIFDKEGTFQSIKYYAYKLFIWTAKSITPYIYLRAVSEIKEIRSFIHENKDFKYYNNYELEVSLFKVLLFNLRQYIAANKKFELDLYFTNIEELFLLLIPGIDKFELERVDQSNNVYLKNDSNFVVFEMNSSLLSRTFLQTLLFKAVDKRRLFISFIKNQKLIILIKFFDPKSISLFDQVQIPSFHQKNVKFTVSKENYLIPFFLDLSSLTHIHSLFAQVFSDKSIDLESYKSAVATYLLSGILERSNNNEVVDTLKMYWRSPNVPIPKIKEDKRSWKKEEISSIYFYPFYEDFIQNKLSTFQEDILCDIIEILALQLEEDLQIFLNLIETTFSILTIEEVDFVEILYFSINKIK